MSQQQVAEHEATAAPGAGPDPAGPTRSVTHSWTRAHDRELMTHVHRPASGRADAVVVLCDGLARDQVLGFRSYRMLADQLAESGALAVRFAWSDTADSGAPAPDDDRDSLTRWVEDLDAVVALAASLAPGVPVVLVGLRASGLIATRYAVEHPGAVDQILLWEPVGSGRTWLRTQETLHKISFEYRMRQARPPLPEGAVEVPGRLFPAADAAALRAARIVDPKPTRVDVVIRPDHPGDRVLDRFLDGAASVTRVAGQAEALDTPTLMARVSLETLATLVALVQRGAEPVAIETFAPRTDAVVALLPHRGRPTPVHERLTEVYGMHAVVTDAIGAPTRAVLTIPGSGEPMDGPTGLWTRFARVAAGRGVTTLRVDRHGAGEMSDPADLTDPWPYHGPAVDDLATAYDWLRSRTGLRPVPIGMCSGAWIATQVALRTDVDTVIAVNQVAWDVAALPEGNPVLKIVDPSMAESELLPDSAKVSTRDRVRIAIRHALKAYAPQPVWRALAERGQVQMPAPLYDRVTARGTAIHQLLSGADLDYVNVQQMTPTVRRLVGRGRRLTITRRPELDHSLLSDAARRSTVTYLLAMLGREPAGTGTPVS